MWKTVPFVTKSISSSSILLAASSLIQQQIRTTYILKRKFPPQLHKKGSPPKKLRSRHYIYDLVEDTNTKKQEDIDVILTTFVEGLGNSGEKIKVKPQFAYNSLLLPGLAVYACPENLEKYKDTLCNKESVEYSSPNALPTIKTLSRITLSVVMNKDHPWVLKPWHVKTSFRKSGYVVPDDAITLPEKPITGPDMGLENKEFYVTVTINNKEKVNVRCRLHHWSTDIIDRIPYTPYFWEEDTEPIYPEFKEVLETLPKKVTKSVNKN
ncbi:hypothetical protein GWI33_006277 [Rhynchophorus ferrugineus]|uniref:Large ribosomal subunit protein bL9m n=1 Tax=Rhynchophorus ferrugineus TaxID=354439 RepID=A0A834IHY1_RHYFE|nr:hypothetical protein GWI33_006277 [Rhynchophorus ferrugineus]